MTDFSINSMNMWKNIYDKSFFYDKYIYDIH